jgi:hypothetical protein
MLYDFLRLFLIILDSDDECAIFLNDACTECWDPRRRSLPECKVHTVVGMARDDVLERAFSFQCR